MQNLFEPSSSNAHEYSVSEISGALKRTVENTFGYVRVRGEIGNQKRASSGHFYFDLKDEKSVLNSICWKGTMDKLNFSLDAGLEVICTGKLTTYPGRSSYQLIVERVEPAGAGALMALLEQRKAKLMAEGLFDPARKKELPFLPEKIGVVTSPTGAVIRDILHRISERFPLHVQVWPVRVQGEGAAEEIAAAITGFNNLAEKPDIIIVARGGGSLEDLWAFNEEIVVRAVADSKIPLISAIGHETDTTLIDFAADLRAPTPTAAAELAVPVRAELLGWVKEVDSRLYRSVDQLLRALQEKIAGLARGLPRPTEIIFAQQQRLDDRAERLAVALPNWLANKEKSLQVISAALSPHNLRQIINLRAERLQPFAGRAQQAMNNRLQKETMRLENSARMLASLDYHNTLKRGFALVKSPKGKAITSKTDLGSQENFQVQFWDGEVSAQQAKNHS